MSPYRIVYLNEDCVWVVRFKDYPCNIICHPVKEVCEDYADVMNHNYNISHEGGYKH